jgi:hypothetical protein
MMVRHPRPALLRRWLEGALSPRVERHIATCDRCATQLADLQPETPAGPDLRTFLTGVLDPAPGVIERVEERVALQLERPSFVSLVSDLYAAGFDTVNLLMFQEDPPRD